jgi:hypothetical protein
MAGHPDHAPIASTPLLNSAFERAANFAFCARSQSAIGVVYVAVNPMFDRWNVPFVSPAITGSATTQLLFFDLWPPFLSAEGPPIRYKRVLFVTAINTLNFVSSCALITPLTKK